MGGDPTRLSPMYDFLNKCFLLKLGPLSFGETDYLPISPTDRVHHAKVGPVAPPIP